MAKKHDYIPRPDAEFALWFDNLGRQVGLHTSGAAAWERWQERVL
jgi:hypothetical protein